MNACTVSVFLALPAWWAFLKDPNSRVILSLPPPPLTPLASPTQHIFSFSYHNLLSFRITYIPAGNVKEPATDEIDTTQPDPGTPTSTLSTPTASLLTVNGSSTNSLLIPPSDDGLSPIPSFIQQPERIVDIDRHPEFGLGISIIGGRHDENDDMLKGIYIKHVLETSPAGQTGLLRTGDQILEVRVF